MQELGCLTSLTSLELLVHDYRRGSPSARAPLHVLVNLSDPPPTPAADLATLSSLTNLRCVKVTAELKGSLPPQALSTLTRLTALQLVGGRHRGMAPMLSASHLLP